MNELLKFNVDICMFHIFILYGVIAVELLIIHKKNGGSCKIFALTNQRGCRQDHCGGQSGCKSGTAGQQSPAH